MKITLIRIVLILLLACSPALLPVLKPVLPAYTNITTVYKIFFLTPFILFGLVAFLGLRLNQTRILYSMAVFTLLFILTDHPAVAALQSLDYSLFLKTLLVLSVLNFLLLFSLDEGALLGFSSFLKASGDRDHPASQFLDRVFKSCHFPDTFLRAVVHYLQPMGDSRQPVAGSDYCHRVPAYPSG